MGADSKSRIVSFIYIYFACLALVLPLRWLLGWGLAVLAHESGHWIAVRICGGKILSVSAVFGGLDMSATPLTRGKMIVCLFCGPLFGVLPVIFCQKFPALAVCCFLLTIYNLIPIRPLDGGRILELLLCRHKCLLQILESAVMIAGITVCIYLSVQYNAGYILALIMAQLIVKNRKLTCKRGYERVQ